MSMTEPSQPQVDCTDITELIADYAFGLSTPEEIRLVEANLHACPEATAQLADYQRLQDEMRASVAQVEPSARLRERLITATGTSTSVKPLSPRHPPLLTWLAAAAVIALVFTNLYWFSRFSELTDRQEELAEAFESALVVSESDTEELRWVRLPPQEDIDSTAVLVWNPDSQVGLLYAREFPVLEPGKTYQLWLNRGEERISAGTFEVDDTGEASYLFHISEPIDNYAWARVTSEPEQGSEQPSGTVLVAGELS